MESTDTVGGLLGLQEIDLEIRRVRQQLESLDREMLELAEEVEELETRAARLEGERAEADERVRRFQRSVQAGRATLKRLETRSAAVANMQQHFAVRTETDTARRNLRVAEDEALDAMQDVETLTARLEELGTTLAETRSRYESRRGEIERLKSSLEADLRAHESQRAEQEGRLDRRALQLYRSVGGGRAGSALAALTEDGVCGACFTAVPLQRQADIRAGRDLAVCEGCGVILYVTVTAD